MARNTAGVGPKHPQVVVLFGATGDLARRKLLPGLFHLVSGGFIPGCSIIGVSLDPNRQRSGFARWRAARSTNSRPAPSMRRRGRTSPRASNTCRSAPVRRRCGPRSNVPSGAATARCGGCTT